MKFYLNFKVITMEREVYKTNTIEDTELIYTILREKYPNKQIEIEFNDNTKDYTLKLTDSEFLCDPKVPLNVTINVIYGDSITGDSPLLLMKNNQVYIETIQSIFDDTKKVEYPGFKMFDQTIRLEKEYSLTDYKIWSDQGWVNINKVIRHKCDKKIYKVLTHTGYVKVTEDHSLITENKEHIKPKECNLNTKLLNSYPSEFGDTCDTIVKFKKNIKNNKQNDAVINDNEKFIKLKDYSNYSVSNLGTVKNNTTNKLLKPKINNGYYIVSIKNNNKYTNVYIHRLVAITFLDNNENKLTVNHKNHNKLDNKIENLEWATMNEQNIHKRKRENTPGRKVLQYDLDMNFIKSFNTVREAGKSINQEQNSSNISKVCKGNLESYMNFIWKYNQEDILENEIWKELIYGDHIFKVSSYGRIMNKNGHCSYGSLENSGYLRTSSTLNKQIMKKFVHVLVAEAFITKPNDNENLIVNHKDSDKSNNKLQNLEWVTFSENSKHSFENKKQNVEYTLIEKEVEVWGFFMKYGELIDTYYECNVRKCKWVLYNEDINKLEYFKEILESIENTKFQIIKMTKTYKLTPITNVKYLVDKYKQIFFTNNETKKVPTEILNSNVNLITIFLNGYGILDFTENIFDEDTQIGSAGLYYLMKKLGYNVSLNTRNDKEKMLIITITKKKQRKISNKIKKIESFEHNHYVYDIETDIGRFQAGVGDLIVKNTDSVFLSIKFNRKDFEQNRKDAFKLAIQCGDNITNDVFKRPPIDLEFEKVYQPFILLTKKRYIGKKYEDTSDPLKLKTLTTSGIAITKRNYCNMVKKCYKQVIDIIMDSSDLDEAISVYKKYIDRIDNYQIDTEDLVISAQIGKEYSCKTCKKKVEWIIKCDKCKTLNPKMEQICKGILKNKPCYKKFECLHTFSLGHINLAQKFLFRNDEICIGDRIQYIFVENENTNVKSELTEDPIFAKNNNIKYNRGCYLEQLAKSIMGFFKVVLQNEEELIDDLLEFTNEKLVEYGSTKLKISDFKITDE